ncbi:cyclin-I [Puntigrus tetrazona]|uniref:cyclin-I n=1 Tax=Puntigrus tetrazona TaxID=1606681 RepID=UPI001C8A575E|nr:cyclin-I [Puntigrus tetrazona]
MSHTWAWPSACAQIRGRSHAGSKTDRGGTVDALYHFSFLTFPKADSNSTFRAQAHCFQWKRLVSKMKPPGEEENRRLGTLLLNTLEREMRLWRAPVLKNGCIQGSDIRPPQYHEVIVWLREMSSLFRFSSETFALGVCVLNSLLATVKTQLKYLKCMAITSLILAAKINEEDEVIASVKDLLEQSRCTFSTAEILRMERVILNKLHWDLYIATPVDFVHIVSRQKSHNPFNAPVANVSKN